MNFWLLNMEEKKLTTEQTFFVGVHFLWRLKICNALFLSCGIKAAQNAIDSQTHTQKIWPKIMPNEQTNVK